MRNCLFIGLIIFIIDFSEVTSLKASLKGGYDRKFIDFLNSRSNNRKGRS